MADSENLQPRSQWRNKKQIAAHFGISERHVTELMIRRVLPYSKFGRAVRFHVGRCEAAMLAAEMQSAYLRN